MDRTINPKQKTGKAVGTLGNFHHPSALQLVHVTFQTEGKKLNHPYCQESLKGVKAKEYFEFHSSGEEVFINYGNYGNAMLAEKFGFTVEHNPNDQVEVWMGLFQHDALYNLKLELLQSHGMPMLPKFGGSVYCGNYFPIREVKATKGRGKGIPQSLHALARVLCAVSDEELIDMARQAAETDGRLARQPFKDNQKELQAMMILVMHLDFVIRDYVAAIAALQVASFCNVETGSVTGIRRKIVEDILDGEVRILRAATNWLKHYCIALKSLL
ncbi:hypothetical protein L7F22_058191 [Adiantum nelumboides]|nr:hypothetical protein [Adiantum nelumboides]